MRGSINAVDDDDFNDGSVDDGNGDDEKAGLDETSGVDVIAGEEEEGERTRHVEEVEDESEAESG